MMREKDVFRAIVGKGLIRGVLTVDEINYALPVSAVSLDSLEDLMGALDGLGVRVVDYGERLN